jgi:predicted nucleic acid-binding protein
MSIVLQDPLVFDASAVFCFGHQGELAFLLERLRSQFYLVISRGVQAEVVEEENFDYPAFIAQYFEVREAKAGTSVTLRELATFSAVLDRGEIDVILLTIESNGTAVIDERRARQAAGERGLRVTGTFGLMGYAIENEWMTDADALQAVATLRTRRFRCPDPAAFTTYAAYLASFAG